MSNIEGDPPPKTKAADGVSPPIDRQSVKKLPSAFDPQNSIFPPALAIASVWVCWVVLPFVLEAAR